MDRDILTSTFINGKERGTHKAPLLQHTVINTLVTTHKTTLEKMPHKKEVINKIWKSVVIILLLYKERPHLLESELEVINVSSQLNPPS